MSFNENSKVGVVFEDGTLQQKSMTAGSHHFTWVFDSPDAEWHPFKIVGKSWALHGCEITRL